MGLKEVHCFDHIPISLGLKTGKLVLNKGAIPSPEGLFLETA